MREGYKICKKCNIEKPLKEFYFREDTKKYRNECKECRNKYNLNLYHTNPKQKDNHRKASWKHQIYKAYNLTVEAFRILESKQGGRCAICKRSKEEIKRERKKFYEFSVDHNHKTGKVRGLLCPTCNTLLGHAKDDIQILYNAIEYLKE